jgi:hypothetical protein
VRVNEAQLFVVRVWHQLSGFRAAVRRVDCDETQLFTAPEQMTQYLVGSAAHTDREHKARTPPQAKEIDDGPAK